MIYILPLIITSLILALTMYIERRSFFLGIIFIIWIISAYITFISYSKIFIIRLLLLPLAIMSILIIFAFTAQIASFLISFFISTYRLIKNQKQRLEHQAIFVFGVLTLSWFFVFPLINNQVSSPIIEGLNNFIGFIIIYFFLLILVFTVTTILNHLQPPFKDYDYILVLGCRVHGGNVSPLLASRLDKANDLFHKYNKPDNLLKIIVSGGRYQEKNISEASVMASYLIEKGIPKELIILEENAGNTFENFEYAIDIINHDYQGDSYKLAKILTVTNNFHLLRSLLLARKIGLKTDGAGSRTKLSYWLKVSIKELMAIIYHQKIYHIIIVFIMIIILVLFF